MDEADRLIRVARRTMQGRTLLCSELDAYTLSLRQKPLKGLRKDKIKD